MHGVLLRQDLHLQEVRSILAAPFLPHLTNLTKNAQGPGVHRVHGEERVPVLQVRPAGALLLQPDLVLRGLQVRNVRLPRGQRHCASHNLFGQACKTLARI